MAQGMLLLHASCSFTPCFSQAWIWWTRLCTLSWACLPALFAPQMLSLVSAAVEIARMSSASSVRLLQADPPATSAMPSSRLSALLSLLRLRADNAKHFVLPALALIGFLKLKPQSRSSLL